MEKDEDKVIEYIIKQKIKEFIDNQKDIDDDIKQILYSNLWELYD